MKSGVSTTGSSVPGYRLGAARRAAARAARPCRTASSRSRRPRCRAPRPWPASSWRADSTIDRHRRPPAQRAEHVEPVDARAARGRARRCRGARVPRFEALLAGRGGLDVVAAGPQADRERAHERRFVVDRRAACVTVAASGRLTIIVQPAAGRVLDRDVAAASPRRTPCDRRARARRRRRSGCRRGAGTAGTRARARSAGCPRPWSMTRRSTRRRPRRPGSARARPGGEKRERVGDDVGERPLEQHRVDVDRRQVSGTSTSMLRRAVRGSAIALPTTSSSADRRGLHDERAGLEPAHVEQVADERVEPVGFVVDRLEQLVRGGRVERDVLREQARRRGLDRRERRAQVVAHGREQRGAQLVGLRQRRGLGRLGLEPPALERDAELRRERVEHLPVFGAQARRRAATSTASPGRRQRDGPVDRVTRAGASPGGRDDRPAVLRRLQHRAAVEPEGRDEVGRRARAADRRREHEPGHPRQRPASARARYASLRRAGREVDERADHRRRRRGTTTSARTSRPFEIVKVWIGGAKNQFSSTKREHRRDRRPAPRRRSSRPRRRAAGSRATRSAVRRRRASARQHEREQRQPDERERERRPADAPARAAREPQARRSAAAIARSSSSDRGRGRDDVHVEGVARLPDHAVDDRSARQLGHDASGALAPSTTCVAFSARAICTIALRDLGARDLVVAAAELLEQRAGARRAPRRRCPARPSPDCDVDADAARPRCASRCARPGGRGRRRRARR